MEHISRWIEKAKVKGWIVGIVAVGGVCLVVGIWLIAQQTKEDSSVENPFSSMTGSEKQTREKQENKKLNQPNLGYVDVKGAVLKCGMYQITEDMRVIDVVRLAGGFLADADENRVNFSLKVTDQMVLYIPRIGEELSQIETLPTQESKAEATQKKQVNINRADVAELKNISGIGEKKAEEIMRYREENGSFQKKEELMNVPGIGKKIFESLEKLITVD
ncbi:helix-hairpin-helix domain-containing protein [Vagococcus entomophilus]|uniref:Helix-hairpin-helix DNA-binding motif class 1 domain-containing protein n=1 Tax=Vagococcus entomophilus TaxID=1160095 RepID=A0A430AFL7_9ENTE|nr:helix-hairpin-helix domain-containing protein [Vagococcus entomophilus]RSU06485.1 hypothetical protein CBF30_09530 [Vagococcus entomophilus]